MKTVKFNQKANYKGIQAKPQKFLPNANVDKEQCKAKEKEMEVLTKQKEVLVKTNEEKVKIGQGGGEEGKKVLIEEIKKVEEPVYYVDEK